ncbi:MAG: flavin reductase family protein [bacterium]
MKVITRIEKVYYYYPNLVTVVGVNCGEKENFMSAVWNTGLSFDPPLFGVAIAPSRYSHSFIQKTGEFSCNFLPFEELDMVHFCGRTSGKDVDKVRVKNLPVFYGVKTRAPLLSNAYCAMECKLVHTFPTGDHNFFVGEILAIHYREDAYDAQVRLMLGKIRPVFYLGKDTYCTADPASISEKPRKI